MEETEESKIEESKETSETLSEKTQEPTTTEELILRIINLVSEKSNLKILKMLPSDEETIKNTLELSDYNYYRKMKRFRKNGLVELNSDTDQEVTTKLGKFMIESLDVVIDKSLNQFDKNE